jgi:hypothetical protein
MHFLQTNLVLRWIGKYWFPLWIGIAFFVDGASRLIFRGPTFWFEFTRLSFSLLMLGFLSIPIDAIYSAIIPPTTTQYNWISYSLASPTNNLYLKILCLIAISALIAWICWRVRGLAWFNNLLRLVFVINLLLVWLYVVFSWQRLPIVGYAIHDSCDSVLSKTTSIRVQYFADISIEQQKKFAAVPPIQGTAYLLTTDSGRHWQPFLKISDWRGNCDHTGYLDDHIFWLSAWGGLVVTHDAGQTWHLWTGDQIKASLPNSQNTYRYSDVKITRVTFQDQTKGTMAIDYFDYQQQTTHTVGLATIDGGLTWYLPS